jgi:hypothetical protein
MGIYLSHLSEHVSTRFGLVGTWTHPHGIC